MAKKILIVDDEEDMVSMMQERLSANGFDVISASDGLKALAKVKKEKPDLIISDVLMPNMDGFAFCKELKKDPDMSRIPVLILTARGKMIDTFSVMGVNDFLVKPFDANHLLEKINQTLNKVSAAPNSEIKTPPPPASAASTAKKDPAPSVSDSKLSVSSKKVFVLGSSASVLETIGNSLAERQCLSITCTDISKAFNQLVMFKPDILISEVLVGDKPAKDFILKVKKNKGFENIPILVFGFIDKKDVSSGVAQKTLDVDKARNMCLEAGVTECIREFEEGAFSNLLKDYV